MAIVLHQTKFISLMLGALMVIGGVISKNTAEQMGIPNHEFLNPLG